MNRSGMIKAVWAISSQLGIDKGDVYSLLYQETKKEHMNDCADTELRDLLKRLDNIKEKKVLCTGRLTNSQRKYIHNLEAELGWQDDAKRLKGFIKRTAKVDSLEWLTPTQASKVIIGLKKVLESLKKGVVNEHTK